jgi:hypothetical protein
MRHQLKNYTEYLESTFGDLFGQDSLPSLKRRSVWTHILRNGTRDLPALVYMIKSTLKFINLFPLQTHVSQDLSSCLWEISESFKCTNCVLQKTSTFHPWYKPHTWMSLLIYLQILFSIWETNTIFYQQRNFWLILPFKQWVSTHNVNCAHLGGQLW